jgi:hypothetical protein
MSDDWDIVDSTTGAALRTALDEIPRSQWSPSYRTIHRALRTVERRMGDGWEVDVALQRAAGRKVWTVLVGPPVGMKDVIFADGRTLGGALRKAGARMASLL